MNVFTTFRQEMDPVWRFVGQLTGRYKRFLAHYGFTEEVQLTDEVRSWTENVEANFLQALREYDRLLVGILFMAERENQKQALFYLPDDRQAALVLIGGVKNRENSRRPNSSSSEARHQPMLDCVYPYTMGQQRARECYAGLLRRV